MGVFARLAQLIKANLNDLISRSEDPEKMLNQIILDMNSQLLQAKKGVALAIADLKQLEKQAEQEAANAAEWERRAMVAVRKGNDELAAAALQRKREHDDLAQSFLEQYEKQKTQVDTLKDALRRLNDKIEEARRRKTLLIARKKRAEVQKAISETLNDLKDSSAFAEFERFENKIERMEVENEAQVELAEEYTGDDLAKKFKDLEKQHSNNEDLIALKKKMGIEVQEPAKEAPKAPAAEAPAAPTPAPQIRVPGAAAKPGALSAAEEDELAAALAEIEAEEEKQRDRIRR